MGVRRLVAGLAVAGLATPAALALSSTAGAATSAAPSAVSTASLTTELQQLVFQIDGVVALAEEVVTCFNPCIVR
jgi:hypothetical protein